ncbi:YqaJ viral recombinase family protein [Corynebacterium auriscanis]|uniref:YqaJ viral recombinase family protein n=1 Tax=Corynebacterium auriscanis TaxID=99807 RepID=UPI003CF517B6
MTVEKLTFETDVEWLDARKDYVTATEVAKLARGGEKVWCDLRAHKAGEKPNPDISHLRAVQHGKQREPFIAEWVAENSQPEKLEHNTSLFVRDGKYAATPDMITPDWVVVSEIKTISETRLASLKRWPTPEYYDQIQWQLFVTGADQCVFAWEPYFVEGGKCVPWVPMGKKVISRDEKRMGELKTIADRFLAGENNAGVDDMVHVLFSELRDILKREEEIKPLLARKAEIESELRELAGGESRAWDTGDLRVSVSAGGVSKRFDKKKLFAAHPDLRESDYVTESQMKPRVRITFNG